MGKSSRAQPPWALFFHRYLLVASAVLLAGCGPKGSNVGAGTTQQDRGTQLATTVVLTQKWSEILYGALSPDAGPVCEATPPESITLPDGTPATRSTDAHCVEETDLDLGVNKSQHIIKFPGAEQRTVTETETILLISRTIGRLRVERVYAEAGKVTDTVNFTRERDNRGTPGRENDDLERYYDTEVKLKGQGPATFTLAREVSRQDKLEMDLPGPSGSDRAHYSLTVPLQRDPQDQSQLPRFGSVTDGAYTAGGQTLQFHLRGGSDAERAWKQIETESSDGMKGIFLLNSDFSGRGQFQRPDGEIDSSVSFNKEGSTRVTLASGDVRTAGPSAAALAFLAHLWRELTAQSAP